jgi:phage-related protein (TIGR01555 family)
MVKKENSNSKQLTPIDNSLEAFATNIGNIPQLNKLGTFTKNNRYQLLFWNRQLLSELYIEHGIVQALIEQPVLDAFSKGYEIKTDLLDDDQLTMLENYMADEEVNDKIQETCIWGRLYGGGGLVIQTNQNPKTPLNLNQINDKTQLDFYAADLWELNMQYYHFNQAEQELTTPDVPYILYNQPLHKSRVIKFVNKKAPSWRRREMRGWGMSELERVVRSVNQYLKNNNVIFDLVDEAKIDIYKIKGFNTALGLLKNAQTNGQSSGDKLTNRVELSNMIKNHLNALVMDTEDEYEQKQVDFTGLGDMLGQSRIGVSADLRRPMTKLFGLSASGFNAGEDDIENYNMQVRSEVVGRAERMVRETLKVVCQKLFGFIPDDLEVMFPSLRVLTAEQEENIKNAQMNRIIQAVELGIISPEEAKENVNRGDLLPCKVDV